jgi:hypothetical protein
MSCINPNTYAELFLLNEKAPDVEESEPGMNELLKQTLELKFKLDIKNAEVIASQEKSTSLEQELNGFRKQTQELRKIRFLSDGKIFGLNYKIQRLEKLIIERQNHHETQVISYVEEISRLEEGLRVQQSLRDSELTQLTDKIKILEASNKIGEHKKKVCFLLFIFFFSLSEALQEKLLLQKAKADEVNNSCVICLENQRNAVFLPCGHLCVCISCTTSISLTECPLCRKRVDRFHQVYF